MDGGTIKLLRDVTVNHNDNVALLIQDKEVTIQGEGHTLCLERGSLTCVKPAGSIWASGDTERA